MRHGRESKSSATNFNLSTPSKSTDLGGSGLTCNPHTETLPWWQASLWVRAREQEGGGSWHLFADDALRSIFPRLFDLTAIWVAIQALAYGACEVHKGVSAFSPALSRVTGRNTMTSTSEFIWGHDGGVGSAASAFHLHHDAGSCLATYELLSVFLISAPHSSTQSCKIHNVYDGFRHSRATVTPVRPHSVSRIASELLTMEKCSSRSNKIVRNVTCDVPQTFPSYTVSHSLIQISSKYLVFQTEFNFT